MTASRLMVISETQCTVLEVKVIEGQGTTINILLSPIATTLIDTVMPDTAVHDGVKIDGD